MTSSNIFRFSIYFHSYEWCTKHVLPSNLPRMFDPLGIISPITFQLKYLIQRLWTSKLSLNDSPHSDIIHLWGKINLLSYFLIKLISFSSTLLRLLLTMWSSWVWGCFGERLLPSNLSRLKIVQNLVVISSKVGFSYCLLISHFSIWFCSMVVLLLLKAFEKIH